MNWCRGIMSGLYGFNGHCSMQFWGIFLQEWCFCISLPHKSHLNKMGYLFKVSEQARNTRGRLGRCRCLVFLWVFFGIRPKRQLEATQDKHAIYYEVEYKKHWFRVRSVEDANSLAVYEVVLVQPNSDQKEFVGKSLQLEQARFIALEITLFYGLGGYNYDDKERVQYVYGS